MCAPFELQFGALREGGGTREAGSTVAECLVVVCRVGTQQIRQGRGQLDRRRARGGLNPCARESKAWTGRFLREKPMSDHGHFLPTKAKRSDERARFVGLFQGCTGFWTAGCWLAPRLHQLKASTSMDLGISIFLIFVRCVASRNLDL